MNTAFKTIIVVLGLSQLYSTVSYAGFEFSGQTARAPSSVQNVISSDAPMEIINVPTDNSQITDISNPVQNEVYIKRGRTVSIAPASDEPINTENLLTAVEQGAPVTIAPSIPEESITWNDSQNDDTKLVINPYPLEAQASHTNVDQLAKLDRAMMEQTGMLRPVMTPGKTKAMGLAARTSRINGTSSEYNDMGTGQKISTTPEKVESMKLTPIPGGEAPPIKDMIRLEGRVSKAIQDNTALPSKNLNPDEKIVSMQSQPVDFKKDANIAPPTFSQAAGFGRDLPLALALSQVVPAGYSYVFDGGVDTGVSVTWKGGRPWNEVLNDMLGNVGMLADIKDNQVIIKNKKS